MDIYRYSLYTHIWRREWQLLFTAHIGSYSVERGGNVWAVCKFLEFQSRTLCGINTTSVDNTLRRSQDGVASLASLDFALNGVSQALVHTSNIQDSRSDKSSSQCVLVPKLLDGFIRNLVIIMFGEISLHSHWFSVFIGTLHCINHDSLAWIL